jgi:hypothetical protein
MMKRMLCICYFLLLCVLLSACKSGVVLEAYLVDTFHQRPIPGIKVLVDDQEYLTNEKGFFETPSLKKESVKILVPAQDRYEEFSDQLVLYQRRNIRKFLLDSKHPLGFAPEQSPEPYSYSVQLRSGDDEKLNKVSIKLNSIPYDQSFECTGTYTDDSGHIQSMHMIQIGFNFWFKDEWNNWQYTTIPPMETPLWGMIVDSYVQAMYQFYHDRDYTYEVLPEQVHLNGEKASQIVVKSVKPIELFDEMRLYMLSEGPDQGIIRKAEFKVTNRHWLGSTLELSFEALDQPLNIAPPEITH